MLTAASQPAARIAGARPGAQAQRRTPSATPAVGALFTLTSAGTLGTHFCTAAIVASPRHDLLITAAHCVSGSGRGPIAFVPGYRGGGEPYGIWRVTRVFADSKWTSGADPDNDVAFLTTAGHGSTNVQDVAGGEQLSLRSPAGLMVLVVGYPDDAQAPIRCQNRATAFSATQLQFDCAGYTDGTSGSPLLESVSPSTGLGTVIGVIGGYEQGGDTPSVSYAARFGPDIHVLYELALAGAGQAAG
jgi:V8-like Glu-specific endopeptidase